MDQTEAQKLKTLRTIRGPLIIGMIMIGFIAIYVLSSSLSIERQATFHFEQVPQNAHFLDSLFVIGAVLSIIATIWFNAWLYTKRRWLLIGLPLGLILIYTTLLGHASPVILVGTYPVLMIEAITTYQRSHLVLNIITFLYLGMWGLYFLMVGPLLGTITLESFVFVIAIVFYYWRFYQRQLASRQELENLYDELKLAYNQVEAAAIRTERQRVARELHDTFTQDLAGVVLQLDAAQTFLKNGDSQRAAKIIAQSRATTRQALKDSRLTLTDLRSTPEEDLPARLNLVTTAIAKNYHLTTTLRLSLVPDYSPSQLTEITRIVTEALTNVAKHAQTDQALITSQQHDQVFKLKIIDFGVGFDLYKAQKSGHFGLQGLQERAQRLNGVITVVSAIDEGTTVTLTLPITRKE
ncbi:sensor histidine kinase [Loigolactobacillus bifermentans]|jgi:NarL family two-component system sensor histidine kinase YdfH|uniref:histidine kinase n=1 Tax=Loigolactobacillus bifermentans DSM 20003 TaxID=1423726 RepID=A0A0R1H6L4_9LACO|nr:sensor histidine kinase [Loigolactobacillus bifermentans]KRK39473.1 Signal transduction histidine kinase [Loigolactobacillus bifermentans DSM 20003]QGG61240.1 hypothetical protein LB003_12630 [Loigolactobacillus bifermentans]